MATAEHSVEAGGSGGGLESGDTGTAHDELSTLSGEVREGYASNRRVMSFEEFYALVAARPRQYARSSAQYVKDVFDHFGTTDVRTPRGTFRRWRLFDVG